MTGHPHTDAEYARVCREQLIPLTLLLCDAAGVELPVETFDYREVGEQVIAGLMARGFNARFKTVKGRSVR